MLHEDFLRRWAYVEDSATKSGENPMLSWYAGVDIGIFDYFTDRVLGIRTPRL